MANGDITNGDKVTIREVYQLISSIDTKIDNKVGQVTTSMERLENKFDNLESGRLSAVEKDVANIQGRLITVSVLVSSALGIFSIILNYLLRGGN